MIYTGVYDKSTFEYTNMLVEHHMQCKTRATRRITKTIQRLVCNT